MSRPQPVALHVPRPGPCLFYSIDSGYFCAGLIVFDDHVTMAAPILKWTLGKPWSQIEAWCAKKGAVITFISTFEEA